MAATANVSMVQTRSKGAPKGTTKPKNAASKSPSDASPSSSSSSLANALAIAAGAAGVYASYLTQGVLQERLATNTYAGGKRFDGLDALHGAQAAACAVFALLLLGVAPGLRPKAEKKGTSSVAPPSSYWRAGLSNSVGPTLGYLALKNISYPAQVLMKLKLVDRKEKASVSKISTSASTSSLPFSRSLAPRPIHARTHKSPSV